jgi:hypothetical protein
MASVYLETTIPSYLVARPSRDLITAAHQQLTHEWWENAKNRFDFYISEAVLDEIRSGNTDYAVRRLEIVAGFEVLAFSEDVESLIRAYDRRLGLVGSAIADLPHFAYAVAYNMDYLVTWNCKHIANGQVIRRLTLVNGELGRMTPVIVTPEELSTFPGDTTDG